MPIAPVSIDPNAPVDQGPTHAEPVITIASIYAAVATVAELAASVGHPFTDTQRATIQGAIPVLAFLATILHLRARVFSPATVARIQREAVKVGISMTTGVAAHDIAEAQTFVASWLASRANPAVVTITTTASPAIHTQPNLDDGAADDPTASVSAEEPPVEPAPVIETIPPVPG